ncbi:hypothetical protein M9H77_07132 [Catharanthus roseus]|uniref:Uncharacterized protein n=1 Tax=Catharanthus roseus TaxID=4058 RepID=A0ACC0BUB5_CATRO|nr:hypothetical protein M9H77_07132 [Catharanthus roseus]
MLQLGSTDNLVVNTSQTPYERSITKQPHYHITSQNRLQILVAPARSALGPTLVSNSSWLSTRGLSHRRVMRCPRRPIGHTLHGTSPLFKWIHSTESKTSMPSKKALVQRTSHVQCNSLTLPYT